MEETLLERSSRFIDDGVYEGPAANNPMDTSFHEVADGIGLVCAFSHVWNLRTRKHLQTLDLGSEQQMVLELRPAHDPNQTYGFAGVVISRQDLSASVWAWYREQMGL